MDMAAPAAEADATGAQRHAHRRQRARAQPLHRLADTVKPPAGLVAATQAKLRRRLPDDLLDLRVGLSARQRESRRACARAPIGS